ncbi:uncharacterized protein PHACADRAFT_203414 [Phanerochaete carnosa HHB-10118-sp]|uniref:Uncharacterized protein n=1 Tax=Phanerochaete carnosa (strain HHB-10118-sp) TaxID=650164 RepID=K5VMR7_PHACS|nr:uncharacterized protein PHACADRAFT_203414 [Phanerochaete carnosa HHB-10118-sp]EKM47985.1 hypothetical protein PHACADRAFT_203414 [Phanerochaete carnosa HHB-10118-sp]
MSCIGTKVVLHGSDFDEAKTNRYETAQGNTHPTLISLTSHTSGTTSSGAMGLLGAKLSWLANAAMRSPSCARPGEA